MKKRTSMVIVLIIAALLITLVPLFMLGASAEFGGSDGQGSEMVDEVTGGSYEPWFTPVLETAIGGEIPGEVESLFFCVQTGIGVGIIAYAFGYLVARKKYNTDKPDTSKPGSAETFTSEATTECYVSSAGQEVNS